MGGSSRKCQFYTFDTQCRVRARLLSEKCKKHKVQKCRYGSKACRIREIFTLQEINAKGCSDPPTSFVGMAPRTRAAVTVPFATGLPLLCTDCAAQSDVLRTGPSLSLRILFSSLYSMDPSSVITGNTLASNHTGNRHIIFRIKTVAGNVTGDTLSRKGEHWDAF